MGLDASFDDIGKLLLLNEEVNFKIKLLVGICSVNIAQILRNVLVEDKSANCAVDELGNSSVTDILGDTYLFIVR